MKLLAALSLGFAVAACSASYAPAPSPTDEAPLASAPTLGPSAGAAPADLDAPGPIELETVVSAHWTVPLSGLLDLHDPRTHDLHDGLTKIVLAVHVLRHPTKGLYIVDTGVPRSEHLSSKLVSVLLSGVEPVKPLADIVGGEKLAGVFFTHLHIDHVLGLPEIPNDVPLFTGPGELEPVPGSVTTALESALLGKTFAELLAGHDRHTFDLTKAQPFGPVERAIDVFGDGSLYALHVPGHTEGSMAYVVRSTKGPVLLAGDTSHTIWGWDHEVTPGFFSESHEKNAVSLHELRTLAAQHPKMKVVVGHETDGAGTGVD